MSLVKMHLPDWKTIPIEICGIEARFSADQLINAYFRGKSDYKKAQLATVHEYVRKIQDVCEKIFNALEGSCLSIQIKVSAIGSSSALFLIKEDDFYGKDLYLTTDRFISEAEDLGLNFMLMAENEFTDHDSIHCDGYVLQYVA